VFDREPPPSDNPLFKLDNVVLTAHFAGPTWDNHTARLRNAFDNVERVHRGEAPLWVVPELAGGTVGGGRGVASLADWIERRPAAAFVAFAALHLVVWTALPTILYKNLPLDLIEALTYGREWQLGYDKLPPLPWWVVEIVDRAFGSDVAYYALSTIVILIPDA